jgi:pilus assembly protein CpaE
MAEHAHILAIVSRDDATAQAVRAAMEGKAVRPEWRQFGRLDALARSQEVDQTAAALVDIDNDPETMLSEVEALSLRFPHIRFIVLAHQLQNDLLLKAMQAGARHFVVKNRIAVELPGAIDRLALRTTVAHGEGAVVSVLSVGGGCGTTTIAVNLAQELSDLEASPSLIVDLDARFGGAAGLLGVKADYGIADVLATEERLDSTLVRSSAVAVNSNLNLLASPATVNFLDPRPINQSNFRQAAKAFGEAYDFTVIDAGQVALTTAKALATHSTHTLLVFELNVEQMRRARQLAYALTAQNEIRSTIIPVVNRYRSRRACATVDEARKALNTPSVSMINNDYRAVTAGVNQGRPLAFAASRSALRKDIRALAESIHARTAQRPHTGHAAA